MATSHSNGRSLVPAVAYYRMSTDKQDTSIPAQRDAVERYAAQQGFRIVRDYVDEGISGDATEKRLAFQGMIRDAADRGDFRAVLCWDQSRFGRFDSVEAGYWIFPLIKAGVTKLVTVADGEIDFAREDHRMLFNIKQDAGMRRYLSDLARNVTRGQLARAKTGAWVSGKPPYGYRVGDNGHLEMGDPSKVAAVRRIFELRLLRHGKRKIARILNSEGVPSPRGGTWCINSISNILITTAYAGDLVFGAKECGKYFTASSGEVVAAGSAEAKSGGPIVVRNSHPAIIDRETFMKAHLMREQDLKAHTRGQNDGSPLAGLLFCANCGAAMHAVKDRRTSNPSGRRYRCSTYHSGQGCGCCEVPQDSMLSAVAAKIRERVLKGSIDRLEVAIGKAMAMRTQRNVAEDVDSLRRQLSGIQQRIDNAADRILEVERSIVPDIERKLLQLQRERQMLVEKIDACKEKPSSINPKELAKRIWQLDEVLKNGKPIQVRAALRSIVSRIDLKFRRGEMYRNRGFRWHFDGGTMLLCSEQGSNQ